MSDIVETMARAIWEAEKRNSPGNEFYPDVARACLAALEKEGWVVLKPDGHWLQRVYERLDNYTRAELDEIWSAMVAAGRGKG